MERYGYLKRSHRRVQRLNTLQSTVVKAISGVHTVRFKNELVRNITIKLGYANAKVRWLSLLSNIPLKYASDL